MQSTSLFPDWGGRLVLWVFFLVVWTWNVIRLIAPARSRHLRAHYWSIFLKRAPEHPMLNPNLVRQPRGHLTYERVTAAIWLVGSAPVAYFLLLR